jgi:hypothetical protein
MSATDQRPEPATVGGQPSADVSSDVIRRAVFQALKDTSDNVNKLTGSTPNPQWSAILGGELRNVSSGLGWGIGVYSQTVSGQTWQLLAGIIIGIAPLVATWISKRWDAIRNHEGNKASAAASAIATAAAGAPVAVPVQPA